MMSKPIVITPVSKPLKMIFSGSSVALPVAITDIIEKNWEALAASGRSYTRGDVFTINEIHETPAALVVTVDLTDYAHYQATISGKLDDTGYAVRIIYTAILVQTSDNYIVLGKMGSHTSGNGVIQGIGGGITREDLLDDGHLDVERNAKHELLEEINLDTNDETIMQKMSFAYLKTGGVRDFTSAVYIAETILTAQEVDQVFKDYCRNLSAKGELSELSELVFILNTPEGVETFLRENTAPLQEHLPELLRKHTSI